MEIYKFADIPVGITTRGSYFAKKARDYRCDKEEPFFCIEADDKDIEYELLHSEGDVKFTKAYLEYVSLYRLFCEKAINYSVVLCHGSAVEVDGKTYIFTAPSGTGKSTHTRLWRQLFKDRAVMINDDKPLLKFEKDGIYVYGTPWDGKHGISTNKKSKLYGICFLNQDITNHIEKINSEEAFPTLIKQIYRPRNVEDVITTLKCVEQIISKVPTYKMGCNMDIEAAQIAYETMSGADESEKKYDYRGNT